MSPNKPFIALLAYSIGLFAFTGQATAQSLPHAKHLTLRTLPASVLPARMAAVRAVLQDGVDKKVAPGFSAALIDGFGRIETTYVGVADLSDGKAIDGDTIFRLFSMTKPITAVAVMILVEEGKLKLDAPLSTYIPSFANTVVYVSGETVESLKTEPQSRPLTLRDLLRQSAGMPYFGAEKPVERLYAMKGIERSPGEMIPDFKGPRVASLQELTDRIAAIPLAHQPGATYTYGNAIDVLGRVVEIGSGQKLGEFFKERIFAPLGMTHTGFQVQPGDSAHLANLYVAVTASKNSEAFFSHKSLKDIPPHEVPRPVDPPAISPWQSPAQLEFGGSGLVGTLGDYTRFARMIAGGGELDGVRLLKATTIAEMGSDQLGKKASGHIAQYGYSYGLGFGRVMDSALSHSGAPSGTMFWSGAAGTFFWANPKTKEAGVIMTQVIGDFIRVYQGAACRAAHGVPVQ
ncbi:serine hydrolase domain-containing protein [Candidatus Phycosocius spiralis]|uniref:Serine hydrolase n=1 Tax=Candidatus Phycosocius spiralis TaxID=2815099 RepID=A0ABQ4PUJ3_9PROT|nr:serine hydrolase domain-containing protein [Candidatus Phycosocius spiralis]GIU66605.1 serine hydrolase [Candidatus Phycosocius spiralis]